MGQYQQLPVNAISIIIMSLFSTHVPANESQGGGGEGTAQLEELVVEGTDTSPDIGRNTLKLKELPRSVQVISNDVIQTVRPYAIEDVVTLTSNVAFLGDIDGRRNAFVMRGFQNPPILRDGFRVEQFGGVSDPELFNLERIEVLKGPDSLYGESNPGGLINMVSKRPRIDDHTEFSIEGGSFGSVSPRVDIGRGTGNVRVRLVGLYKHDDGWRNFTTNNKRIFIAPSLIWNISDATSITLISEYTKDNNQADFGTAISTGGGLTADPGQVNNHPRDTMERRQLTAGFDIKHDNGPWTVDARMRMFNSGYEYSSLWLPTNFDEKTYLYARSAAKQQQDNKEIATQLNLAGDFEIGQMRNRLFTGLDYRHSETENKSRFSRRSKPSILDWRNPDYSQLPPKESSIPSYTIGYTNDRMQRFGIYLQDHLSLTQYLIVSMGIRYDDFNRDPLKKSVSPAQSKSATSFQGGIVYQFRDNISVYGSYSESFTPNFGLDKNNKPLDPEIGKGFETGVKAGLSGGLDINAAFFHITKQNVAMADPSALPTDPNPLGSAATGEQRSRGFELDVSGRIGENWQVFGGYGYTDSEVTKSNKGDKGLPVVGAPNHTASLLVTYTFNSSILRGLNLSASVQHVGKRLAMVDHSEDSKDKVTGKNKVTGRDSVYLSSHTLLNVATTYERDNLTLGLNFYNITDKKYVDAASGGLSRSVYAGSPFQVIGSVSYRF